MFCNHGGSRAFTGNNFVMACGALKKEVSWGKAVKLWIVCYLGNLIGSVVGRPFHPDRACDRRCGAFWRMRPQQR